MNDPSSKLFMNHKEHKAHEERKNVIYFFLVIFVRFVVNNSV